MKFVNTRNFHKLFPRPIRDRFWNEVDLILVEKMGHSTELSHDYRTRVEQAPIEEQILVYHDHPADIAFELDRLYSNKENARISNQSFASPASGLDLEGFEQLVASIKKLESALDVKKTKESRSLKEAMATRPPQPLLQLIDISLQTFPAETRDRLSTAYYEFFALIAEKRGIASLTSRFLYEAVVIIYYGAVHRAKRMAHILQYHLWR